MNTPLLLLIFNRPLTTHQVFQEVQRARPPRLYIAADGPRRDKESDIELCRKTRDIVKEINWNCEVNTLFRDVNLGCKLAVSSAISWFFENEEKGIILEDDCFPHPTFFDFCETMLDRYNDDKRIVHIGGANFQNGIKYGNGDYYFSNLTHVWGWASWRRVWSNYDITMANWPQFKKENHLISLFRSQKIVANLERAFDRTFSNNIDTWDYQYFFSNLCQNGMSIIPNVNLISNIGYTADATHVAAKNDRYANIPLESIVDYKVPTISRPCLEADNFTLRKDASGGFYEIENFLLKLRL